MHARAPSVGRGWCAMASLFRRIIHGLSCGAPAVPPKGALDQPEPYAARCLCASASAGPPSGKQHRV
eukprot:14663059-Alexandrium_andersonii.AAC.1